MSSSDADPSSTLELDVSTGTGYREYLESLAPGDWQQIEDLPAFRCDLGEDLPSLRVEKIGEKWVGKLFTDHPPHFEETEPCDIFKTAILRLRERLKKYGNRLQEKAGQIRELSQQVDE